jgi:gas vesicle protein
VSLRPSALSGPFVNQPRTALPGAGDTPSPQPVPARNSIVKTSLLHSLLLALALLPLGCDRQEATPNTSGTGGVDTRKSETAFASAEAAVKAEFDKVVEAIRSTDWSAAGTRIQDLAKSAKLSDEQKASLQKLTDQIKTKATEMATQAREKAGQLADDARKATGQVVEEAGKLAEKAKDATGKAAQDVSKAVGDLLPKK